jgi:hypothetical protein
MTEDKKIADKFCVVADNGPEAWTYGPFHDENEADKVAEKMRGKYPGIEYTVGRLLAPETAE